MSKAWIIDEDNISVVVFVGTRGKAKTKGAAEMDVGFLDVRVQRAPQYDHYAEEGKAPWDVLKADGWMEI